MSDWSDPPDPLGDLRRLKEKQAQATGEIGWQPYPGWRLAGDPEGLAILEAERQAAEQNADQGQR